MQSIFTTIKTIAFEIEKAIKTTDLSYSTNANSSGDEQLKLDVLSDRIIEKAFATLHIVRSIVSEEQEGELELHTSGSYTICYDPLDGSSLVDVNLSVGSIFGIYEGPLEASNLVASAYVVYGPRLELVIAQKDKKPILYRAVDGFFEEIQTIKLNEKGKLNAPGGTQKEWYPHHKALIENLFEQGYRLRYSGGMVPDLHQILLKGGGLFSYPGSVEKPQGKLRQLFEVIPFAFIYEQAGGQAIDDKGKRLMELTPAFPHDTAPCFFGSNFEIEATKVAYGVS